MDRTTEQHESFGLVGFARVQGSPGPLFGSSIRHHNFIRLRLQTARRTRDLNCYWYSGDKMIAEVDLSATQFADLLTSMNVGDGVPCTIRWAEGREMEECPAVDQREMFRNEFKADMRKVAKNAADLEEFVASLPKQKSVKKSDLEKIGHDLATLLQHIRSNLPFVHDQFNEAMDKTANEAKGEVEAFIQTKLATLGLAALREQVGGGSDMLEGSVAPKALEDQREGK
jgi:hypothetical protein